ncbi:uncharacterized protein AMSG_09323 [Thecamonas trahens ATCC 50062]|uniref:Ras-GAP domain-containing protein n=1 Tax=Thecamonas trahens ATCC 50062 TaxID=461836 RepID=A0A0L0DLW7_THETB|nr:hypothetical protein AMSG_09323 [Thecamonas trahens ATCC 50062]KNC53031.1 hypothetical protein AMSG_09323 [Thecamonas trahens ATCC 50062]|eukprot:XP_013754709.1 hypothetical protein AMSG_09323 [Thecamonas trahens ATCC 50062]
MKQALLACLVAFALAGVAHANVRTVTWGGFEWKSDKDNKPDARDAYAECAALGSEFFLPWTPSSVLDSFMGHGGYDVDDNFIRVRQEKNKKYAYGLIRNFYADWASNPDPVIYQYQYRGIDGLQYKFVNWHSGSPSPGSVTSVQYTGMRGSDDWDMASPTNSDNRMYCMRFDPDHEMLEYISASPRSPVTFYTNPADHEVPVLVRSTIITPSFTALIGFTTTDCSAVQGVQPLRSSYFWMENPLPASLIGNKVGICISNDLGENWRLQSDVQVELVLGRPYPTTFTDLTPSLVAHGSSAEGTLALTTTSLPYASAPNAELLVVDSSAVNADPAADCALRGVSNVFYPATKACAWLVETTPRSHQQASRTCAEQGGFLADQGTPEEWAAIFSWYFSQPNPTSYPTQGDVYWTSMRMLVNPRALVGNLDGFQPETQHISKVTRTTNAQRGFFDSFQDDEPSSQEDILKSVCEAASGRVLTAPIAAASATFDRPTLEAATNIYGKTTSYEVCARSSRASWVHQPMLSLTHVLVTPTSITAMTPRTVGAGVTFTATFAVAPGHRIHSQTSQFAFSTDCSTSGRYTGVSIPTFGTYKLCVRSSTSSLRVEMTGIQLVVAPSGVNAIASVTPSSIAAGAPARFVFSGAQVTDTGTRLALVASGAPSCVVDNHVAPAVPYSATGSVLVAPSLAAGAYHVCYSVDGGVSFARQTGPVITVVDVTSSTISSFSPQSAYADDAGVFLELNGLSSVLSGQVGLSTVANCSNPPSTATISNAVVVNGRGMASISLNSGVPAGQYYLCLASAAKPGTWVGQASGAAFVVFSPPSAISVTLDSPPAVLGNSLSSYVVSFTADDELPGAKVAISPYASCQDRKVEVPLAYGSIDLALSVDYGEPAAQLSKNYHVCYTAEGTRWGSTGQTIQYAIDSPNAMTDLVPSTVLNGTQPLMTFGSLQQTSVPSQVQVALLHPDANQDCGQTGFHIGTVDVQAKNQELLVSEALAEPGVFDVCLTVNGGATWTRQLRSQVSVVNEPLALSIESATPQIVASGVPGLAFDIVTDARDGTTQLAMAKSGACVSGRFGEVAYTTGSPSPPPFTAPTGLDKGRYQFCFYKPILLAEWVAQIAVSAEVTVVSSTETLILSSLEPAFLGSGMTSDLVPSGTSNLIGASSTKVAVIPVANSCGSVPVASEREFGYGNTTIRGYVGDPTPGMYKVCTQMDVTTAWVENPAATFTVVGPSADRFVTPVPNVMGAKTRPTITLTGNGAYHAKGASVGLSTSASCASVDASVDLSTDLGATVAITVDRDYASGPLYVCYSTDGKASYTAQSATIDVVTIDTNTLTSVDRRYHPADKSGLTMTFSTFTPVTTGAIAFAAAGKSCLILGDREAVTDMTATGPVTLSAPLALGAYSTCYTVNRGAPSEEWTQQSSVTLTVQAGSSTTVTGLVPAEVPSGVDDFVLTVSSSIVLMSGVELGFTLTAGDCSSPQVVTLINNGSQTEYVLGGGSGGFTSAGVYYACVRVDSDVPTWLAQTGVSVQAIAATATTVTSLSPLVVPVGVNPVFAMTGSNIKPSAATRVFFSSSASCTPELGVIPIVSGTETQWTSTISTPGNYTVCYGVHATQVVAQTSVGKLVVRGATDAIDHVDPRVVGVGSKPTFALSGVYFESSSLMSLVPVDVGCGAGAGTYVDVPWTGPTSAVASAMPAAGDYVACYSWDGSRGGLVQQDGPLVRVVDVTANDVVDVNPKLFGTTKPPPLTISLNAGVEISATTWFALVAQGVACDSENVDGAVSLGSGATTFNLGSFNSPSGPYELCLSVDGGLSYVKQGGLNVTALSAQPTTITSLSADGSVPGVTVLEAGVQTEIVLAGATASVNTKIGFDRVSGGCQVPSNVLYARDYNEAGPGGLAYFNVTFANAGEYVVCLSVDSGDNYVMQSLAETRVQVIVCAAQTSCGACASICSWCLEESSCVSRVGIGGGACANTTTVIPGLSGENRACPTGTPSASSGSMQGGTEVWDRGAGQDIVELAARVASDRSSATCVSPTSLVATTGTLTLRYIDEDYLAPVPFEYYSCLLRDTCSECWEAARPECGWCVDSQQCTIASSCVNPNATAPSETPLFGGQSCPSVDAIAPLNGLTSGGETVTVTGVLFTNYSRLLCAFDGVPVNETVYVSESELQCSTPQRGAGGAQFTVVAPWGRFDETTLFFVFEQPAAVPKPPEPPLGTSSIVGIAVAGAVCCLLIVLLGILVHKRKREEELYGPPELTDDLRHSVVFGSFGSKKPLDFDAIVAKSGPLLEMLLLPGYEVLHAVVDVTQATEADKVAKAVLILTEAHKLSVDLQKDFITREVFGAQSQATMFRTNSFATKMFKTYSKMQGLDYVHATIGRPLNKIIHDLELEEQKKAKGEAQDETNKFGLLKKCQRMFNTYCVV